MDVELEQLLCRATLGTCQPLQLQESRRLRDCARSRQQGLHRLRKHRSRAQLACQRKQFTGAGVAAAQIGRKRRQRLVAPHPRAKPHQVDHRPLRRGDRDRLAGLPTGAAECARPARTCRRRRRAPAGRVGDPRAVSATRDGNTDGAGHLAVDPKLAAEFRQTIALAARRQTATRSRCALEYSGRRPAADGSLVDHRA